MGIISTKTIAEQNPAFKNTKGWVFFRDEEPVFYVYNQKDRYVLVWLINSVKFFQFQEYLKELAVLIFGENPNFFPSVMSIYNSCSRRDLALFVWHLFCGKVGNRLEKENRRLHVLHSGFLELFASFIRFARHDVFKNEGEDFVFTMHSSVNTREEGRDITFVFKKDFLPKMFLLRVFKETSVISLSDTEIGIILDMLEKKLGQIT